MQDRRCTRPPGRGIAKENFNLVLPVLGFISLALRPKNRDLSPRKESRALETSRFESCPNNGQPVIELQSSDKRTAAIMHPVSPVSILDASIAGVCDLTGVLLFPIAFVRISLFVTDDESRRDESTLVVDALVLTRIPSSRRSWIEGEKRVPAMRLWTEPGNSTGIGDEIEKLLAQHSTSRSRPSFYSIPVVRCYVPGTRFVG